VATLLFVARRRLEAARWSAAVAVGTLVAGWALAQQPRLLPGLTVEQAAAGDATLVALLVSIAVGAVILIPSLTLLFGLVLRGRFDAQSDRPGALEDVGSAPGPARAAGVVAAACALLGVPLTFVFDGGVGLALGVVLLLAAVAAAALFVVPQVASSAHVERPPGVPTAREP
jgi:cytochrome d ubiquinol oxidase subunit II